MVRGYGYVFLSDFLCVSYKGPTRVRGFQHVTGFRVLEFGAYRVYGVSFMGLYKVV